MLWIARRRIREKSVSVQQRHHQVVELAEFRLYEIPRLLARLSRVSFNLVFPWQDFLASVCRDAGVSPCFLSFL